MAGLPPREEGSDEMAGEGQVPSREELREVKKEVVKGAQSQVKVGEKTSGGGGGGKKKKGKK